jgi:hypothetical protein
MRPRVIKTACLTLVLYDHEFAAFQEFFDPLNAELRRLRDSLRALKASERQRQADLAQAREERQYGRRSARGLYLDE